MSTDVVTPEHKAELADKALDSFEAASERARTGITLSPLGMTITPEMVKARIRQRRGQHHADLVRISAVLGRLEGPRCRNGANH